MIHSRKRVGVGTAFAGVTLLVRMMVLPLAPSPSVAIAAPAGGAARSLVASTVLAETAPSVSITSSKTALLNTEVARSVSEYEPAGALAGSVTRTTTL